MRPSGPPGKGSIFVGIAAASFATGPTLVLLLWISALADGEIYIPPLAQFPRKVIIASLICLVGAIPAACMNAFLANEAAKNAMDAPWLPALSGTLIAGLMVLLFGAISFDETPYIWTRFLLTGALMGLLHWTIAIRPRRRWRRLIQRDEETIRAME